MPSSSSNPSRGLVVAVSAIGAVAAMAAAVYFGGHDQLPLALAGTDHVRAARRTHLRAGAPSSRWRA